MNGITVGNAAETGYRGQLGGWFIGHFVKEDPLRISREVEVKWGKHAQGEASARFRSNRTAKTMSVLIQGLFRLTFREGEAIREVVLKHPGDYVLWLPGVEHCWVAQEPSTVLTVRWPSVAQDQTIRQNETGV